MRKIQFVTAIHGNEPTPVLALSSLGIKQIVANPKALKEKVRFVEKDLNASFGTGGSSYEEKRARKLLEKIAKDRLVVDFHTFSANSEPFVVIVDLKMLKFAKTLGLKNIVYMNHNIKKGHSLIDFRDGASIELGSHNDPKSFGRTLKLVKETANNTKSKIKNVVYEVYGIIEKKGKYRNFQMYKSGKGSFYPILAGEKAYDFYGLKAKMVKSI